MFCRVAFKLEEDVTMTLRIKGNIGLTVSENSCLFIIYIFYLYTSKEMSIIMDFTLTLICVLYK